MSYDIETASSNPTRQKSVNTFGVAFMRLLSFWSDASIPSPGFVLQVFLQDHSFDKRH